MFRSDQALQARAAALGYRNRGYNALPSRRRTKRPALDSFAEYWKEPIPESVFDEWRSPNVQLMCGVWWNLAVVDCDGDDARRVWDEMLAELGGAGLRTWKARTGGGGLHTYYRLPEWLDACPSGLLWGLWDPWGGRNHIGTWQRHKEIRLLADGALVIAPPSVHKDSNRRYTFDPADNPHTLVRPALIPSWILKRPLLRSPRMAGETPGFRTRRRVRRRPGGSKWTRNDLLHAIPAATKVDLAAGWGLRLASKGMNPHGWYSCHAYDRDDKHPSASLHGHTGTYHDKGTDLRISFFDLAVALGAYAHWLDAAEDLAGRFAG